jgi:hypothetical protein
VTYCDVQGGFTGLGNINFSPVFGGTGCDLGDLVPVLGSPCVNAGNPDAAGNDTCFPPSLGTTRNDMGITGGPAACNWYPSETSSLVFPSRDVLSWKRSFMDTKYSIYRGLIGAPFTYSHTCLGTSLTAATYTDSALPGSDQGYFYLVSQTNRNGEGSLGVRESRVTVCGNTSTMTQAQRPNLSPCP